VRFEYRLHCLISTLKKCVPLVFLYLIVRFLIIYLNMNLVIRFVLMSFDLSLFYESLVSQHHFFSLELNMCHLFWFVVPPIFQIDDHDGCAPCDSAKLSVVTSIVLLLFALLQNKRT